MLSSAELARHAATPDGLRDTFLTGRLLLRRLAAEVTGVEAASVELVAVCLDCGGPHGRPEVPGSGLHLSLSHGEAAVVAAASHSRVGVDIECADQSAERLAAIGVVAGEPEILRWTRVEAILKADGRGLRVDPREVRIDDDIGEVPDRSTRYRLSEIDLAPGIRISLAEAV